MNRGTVGVVLRVKPREDNKHSDRLTVLDSETGGATVILKKSNRTEELFQYRFYRALENASQDRTYEVCGEDVINSCLDGYNGTILAYGQTGAGKTYSMFGPDEIGIHDVDYHGIMPRAIQHVFCGLQQCLEWSVKMTFVEIYNETFRDLLTNSRAPISVQDNSNKVRGPTSLKGVTPINVHTFEQAFELLVEGQDSRKVAAHAMNDRSSRSHAILTLWIEVTCDDGDIIKSKLNLVDLAGSERTRKTGTSGSIAKEATYINKSLSCLSMVAKELRKKSSHVHYRDSKLTHYLKDSLGGNCRTLMLACVWGDANHLNESLSTCRFADDIQQVEVTVSKNSGVETVHGNLFKLNPAMTKYIDQMMTKRVAQEKAKLFRDLKRRGLVSKVEDASDLLEDSVQPLPMDEYKELENLRRRVKQLEEQEKYKKRSGVGCYRDGSFEELSALRKKVADLESEKEEVQLEMGRRMKEAESSLLEEMQELRVKVCELQKIRALTHSECSELYALRERMAQVAGRRTRNGFRNAYKTWHPSTHMGNCDMMIQEPLKHPPTDNPLHSGMMSSDSTTDDDQSCRTMEEQVRVVGQLEGLRDRLRELHDVAVEKLTKDNFHELMAIRDRIMSFQSGQMMDIKRDNESAVLDELEEMRRKLKELQNISLDQMTPDRLRELACIKDKIVALQKTDRVRSMVGRREEDASRLWTGGSAALLETTSTPPSTIRHRSLSSQWQSSVDSPPTKTPVPSPRDHNQTPTYNEMQYETRPRPLLSLPGGQRMNYIPPFPGSQAGNDDQHDISAKDSSVPNSGCFIKDVGCFTQITSDEKPSLKKRVGRHLWNLVSLGKLGYSQEKNKDKAADESCNIVILNSLTHDQVLELLRDRYTSRPFMGSTLGLGFPLEQRGRHFMD